MHKVSPDVKSAGTVLDILDLLADNGALSLTQITKKLHIPKSSACNVLQTSLS